MVHPFALSSEVRVFPNPSEVGAMAQTVLALLVQQHFFSLESHPLNTPCSGEIYSGVVSVFFHVRAVLISLKAGFSLYF